MTPRSSRVISIVSISMLVVFLTLLAGLTVVAAPALPQDAPELDAQVRALIAQHGLTADPAAGREIPLVTEPIVQLGKALFFTKALGGDMDSACASCHLPTMGGGDDSPLPIGVGALDPDLIGPGRMHPTGQPTVPRNAPTTFNMALWDKVIFHDGRIESLDKLPGANGGGPAGIRTPDSAFGEADPNGGENLAMAQSRFPTTSNEEMRGFDYEVGAPAAALRQRLAARLGGYGIAANELVDNEWPMLFEAVFGPAASPEELVTEQRIAFAIGEYERSQLFINNPWFAYVNGDEDAISDAAKRGALLFYTAYEDGGANCVKCHLGDFFTDEGFHVVAMPQIGPGKDDGVTGTDDYGRFRVTRRLEDLYAFRTPSLLNVTVTGPWGHDGAYTTLEGVVRHMLTPVDAAENFAWEQLDPYIQQEYGPANTAKAVRRLLYNRQRGLDTIQDVALTDAEVADLVAFVEALTDPCVTSEACLAPWMPSAFDIDPDGERLNAKVQEP
jgi:cytochrome c peroxidase